MNLLSSIKSGFSWLFEQLLMKDTHNIELVVGNATEHTTFLVLLEQVTLDWTCSSGGESVERDGVA
jgi:hypothetical protein